MPQRLTAREFHSSEGVGDWRVLYHVVAARFRTESLGQGAKLADAVARLAGPAESRVKVDLVAAGVTVYLFDRDVALARAISAAAAELGLAADPDGVQILNICIDALVIDDVWPFWAALLGYRKLPDDDYLADPSGRGPSVDFQPMDVARPQRNRIHIDVAVPHDQAEARIAAAIAAGGQLVSDAFAPKWWILADPEGNEACIATWMGRD